MTDDERDVEDVVEAIEQYVEFHPDASAIEVVAKRGLDPTRWKDVAEAIIAGEEPDFPDANPRGNADESGSNGPVSSDTTESDDADRELDRGDAGGEGGDPEAVLDVELDVYPTDLLDVERWLTWKPTDDGRKVPRAPYANPDWPDKFVSAQDPDVWTSFETATDAIADRRDYGLAFNIPDVDEYPDDPFVLIDYDDARDPETGEVHPTVRDHIERAESYADVSTSGTGVHIFARGALPDGVKAIEAALPAVDGFDDAEIEVYDSARYSAMTGAHIAASPRRTTDAQGLLDDLVDEYATIAEGTPDELTREPEKSRDQIADVETTTDVQDVLDAIQHVRPRDIRLRSTVTHERADGTKSLDPSFANSSSGTRLAQVDDGWVYRKGMHGLDALQLVALEDRIISRVDEYPTGEDFWNAVDALRERGAHIPEYVPEEGDVEREVVLPDDDVVDADDGRDDWNWRHASRQAARSTDDDDLSIDAARERTVDAIVDAYEHGDRVLVEALPTLGKSFGTIAAAAETGEAITVLTGRGRKEQYEQIRNWCDDHGLDYKTLPSFKRDCDTANGEHGEDWAETVDDWYGRGATPQTIHKHAETELGRPLPCQEHEGQECPYSAKWRFDADEYDVLIGHYSHANKRKVVQGRTVVIDEYPGGAYEQTLAYRLPSAVSRFLATTDAVPFEDYTDLVENRDEQDRRADALAYFLADGDDAGDGPDLDRDELDVLADDSAHALAPLAAFTILAGDDLGNGFERADLGDHGVGLFDRRDGRVHILSPPTFDYTSGVVALDGTPTKALWELTLGERLNHRQVLSDGERREYVRDVLGLKLVRTTEAVKPYNSPDHVAVEQDAALLDAVRERHGERPALITTSAAEHEYDAEGVLDEFVDGSKHYGNVLGSNKFKERRLGVVIGSNHYGDGFVKKVGAYAGETIERGDEKGAGLSYGDFGDDVLTHMREHETLQAAMRFGRDGNGAVVYVHTDTLPDWVPIAGEGRVVKTWSDGQRDVLDAVRDLDGDGWSTADVADHPAVSIGERQVRDHLHDLADRGYLDVDVDGNGYRWTDGDLHRVNDHGEVELDPVDVDDLDDEESAELSRTTTYTWSFRRSSAADGRDGLDPAASDPSTSTATANRGDRGLDGGG
ncbi:hypothetical protein DJ71_13070 [Halorubrum sp. E3]|nr:hypothetical protein DJ71_13070 [Halorubrum sp. E3]